MSENTVIYYNDKSFFTKQIFNYKVYSAIKECEKIKEHLKKKGYLKKEHEKLNLLIASKKDNDIKEKYFLYKNYESDYMDINIKKFKIEDGKIKESKEVIEENIVMVDLYENSVFLYNFKENETYIYGNVVREQKDKEGRSLIFTKEKVKISKKRINGYKIYNNVDVFLDRIML